MVRLLSYTQVFAELCTLINVLLLYHRKSIVFGCQSADKFEFPLYVSRVLFVHGAVFEFDAIPDAKESPANKHKNNTKNFFMFLSFFCGPSHEALAKCGVCTPPAPLRGPSPPQGAN
jgi:hypothetical protein